MRNPIRLKARGGFTLIELMIVVVIVAILSTVAVASYSKYVRQARMQEAIAFLGAIRLRQEAHYTAYTEYVDTGTGADDFVPSTIWNGNCSNVPPEWPVHCPADAGTYPGWCALGVEPGGTETYFQYLSFGWRPGDNIAACTPSGSEVCVVQNPNRPWWVAVARGDQACDTQNILSLAVMSSQVKDVLVFDPAEGDTGKADKWADKQSFSGAF